MPNRSEQAPATASSVASTPAMHITPNVVVAARGDVDTSFTTAFSDASHAGALNMRNLRL